VKSEIPAYKLDYTVYKGTSRNKDLENTFACTDFAHIGFNKSLNTKTPISLVVSFSDNSFFFENGLFMTFPCVFTDITFLKVFNVNKLLIGIEIQCLSLNPNQTCDYKQNFI